MSISNVNIIEACENPALFQPWFRKPGSWAAWFTFLRVLFGLPLSDTDVELFKRCTGRTQPPTGAFLEASLIIGRRGGKSLILALIAVFLAAFRDWSAYLTPGELGVIRIIANDKQQGRIIKRYADALCQNVPAIAALVESIDADGITFKNGIRLEVAAASFRSLRGPTLIACLCDEIAFWRTDLESTNPDTEILAAIRPSMSTIPGAMLLLASSPYARRGVLFESYREGWGQDDAPALVWQASTRTMNPTVPQSVIDKAYLKDRSNAEAEHGAQFRTDIETFVSRDVIQSCVVIGRHELPPISGVRYFGYIDPAGGSGADSFAVGVGHSERNGLIVLDAIRERRPPFQPSSVVAECAELFRSYHISRVSGDKWGGQFPREGLKDAAGVTYETYDKASSELYRDALPLLNSGKVELLDHPRLISQLCNLERRTSRSGGKDVITHPINQHDDIALVVSGLINLISQKKRLHIPQSAVDISALPGPYTRRYGQQQNDSVPSFFFNKGF